MNLQQSTGTARETIETSPARLFECEVDGIPVNGTVYRSRENTGDYCARFQVNSETEFAFDLTKRGRSKYAVVFIRRQVCPGVERLRFTSGSLLGRAVCVVLPIEKAFELGINQCVQWHRELQISAAE